MTKFFIKSIKQAKRLIIAIAGFTVMLIGIAMIVLPGPGLMVIAIGLGILSIEFIWARRVLNSVKSKFQRKSEEKNINETK